MLNLVGENNNHSKKLNTCLHRRDQRDHQQCYKNRSNEHWRPRPEVFDWKWLHFACIVYESCFIRNQRLIKLLIYVFSTFKLRLICQQIESSADLDRYNLSFQMSLNFDLFLARRDFQWNKSFLWNAACTNEKHFREISMILFIYRSYFTTSSNY